MQIALLFAGSLAALTVAACAESTVCDVTAIPYGFSVRVHDSITNQPLARGTIGTADAPGVHDTLITIGDDSATLFATQHIPGTYQIMLRRAGYHDWVTDGITVEPGRCGGASVSVGARLQPITP